MMQADDCRKNRLSNERSVHHMNFTSNILHGTGMALINTHDVMRYLGLSWNQFPSTTRLNLWRQAKNYSLSSDMALQISLRTAFSRKTSSIVRGETWFELPTRWKRIRRPPKVPMILNKGLKTSRHSTPTGDSGHILPRTHTPPHYSRCSSAFVDVKFL